MKLFYEQTFRISRLSKIYRAFGRFTGFKNDACNAFIAKIKEPRVQTQFLVAGVERFELPNDGVRVRVTLSYLKKIADIFLFFVKS